MEYDSNSKWLGRSDTGTSPEVRSVAQSGDKHTSEIFSGWFECSSKPVAEFFPHGFEQGAQSRDFSGSFESRRIWWQTARLKVVKLEKAYGGIGGHRWQH